MTILIKEVFSGETYFFNHYPCLSLRGTKSRSNLREGSAISALADNDCCLCQFFCNGIAFVFAVSWFCPNQRDYLRRRIQYGRRRDADCYREQGFITGKED